MFLYVQASTDSKPLDENRWEKDQCCNKLRLLAQAELSSRLSHSDIFPCFCL